MSEGGRPPRKRKKDIDTAVRFYWVRDIGITECMDRTKFANKTVRTRYEKWDKVLIDRKDEKFLDAQDKAKERALLALDIQITELLSVQQGINKILTNIENPNYTELRAEIRSKVAWMLFDMTDRKASLKMTPSVASRVRIEVRELIERYQNQPVDRRHLEAGK